MGEETDSLLPGICCGGDLPFLISTAKCVARPATDRQSLSARTGRTVAVAT